MNAISQIITPGIHVLTNAAYHSGPGVSKSQLDLVHQSPALLEWSRNAPVDEDAATAVNIGSAFHALLLEPEVFAAEYVTAYEPSKHALVTVDDLKVYMDKRGIAYAKSASKPVLTAALLEADPGAPVADVMRAEWEAGYNGRQVLSLAENHKLMLMYESVMAHPMARKLIEADGFTERSHYWTDGETGELCRCRPDREVPRFGMLLDVKTTADIDKFAFSVRDYRYGVQDAFYSDGVSSTTGEAVRAFVFLAVGTTRDRGRYPVRLFSLMSEDKTAGREEYRADLAAYAECKRSGIWGGIESISAARAFGK